LIGTCGYSYPGNPPNGWSGVFYPKPSGKRVDGLEFYSQFFDSVEINSTFYRLPAASAAKGWLARTPADFRFTVKAWQRLTHRSAPQQPSERAMALDAGGRPQFSADDVQRFFDAIAPLIDAGRLGALLFQYPASFRRDAESIACLESALAALPPVPKAVELRHRSWSEQKTATDSLLERLGATWAFIDEPKFAASVRQELSATGDLAYLRLHGRNRTQWWNHDNAWERYDFFYQPENMQRLADRLRALSGNSPRTRFYVFFNNHARGQAIANAFMLKLALDPTSTPPPRSLLQAFPQLAEFG
jgi:uncharacterized protein YecE (DUF72 family)